MKSLNVQATKVLLSLLAIIIMTCVNTPASAANISTEQQIENSFYSSHYNRPKKKRSNSKRKKHKIKKNKVAPRKKSRKTGKVKHKPCRNSKHRNYDMFGKK